ncbi:cellulosome protein [Streptomyces sp. 3MP-14]|uniref:Cellulosome protein n=1 Tax=Streptomyces mimosae TaxID=2586635 RepID=A0A5N6AEZ9_9ACTN|nr:cellulosome protein [Streptomyces mimosae]KAB8174229.1 cellulosome protein [Streptomyces sp. 3MP-14]
MTHAANGALYGLSDDGVPGDAALAPLRLGSVTQKPEGGQQHPNGDALTVSSAFLRNGGGEILVLGQDDYRHWPYEDLGIDDYLPRLAAIARRIAAHPQSERFVLVPFNEPDGIWYGLNAEDEAEYATGRDRFLADWTAAHARIRAVAPELRIAGPNEAAYDRRFLPEFLAHAARHGTLPDVLTWHELSPSSLAEFRAHHAHYRELERELGIGPLPVNITEYGNRRDLSVPGQLVQWVGMFEEAGVAGNQAYWDQAGNLDGNVVRTAIPNGGWWFFRWYAAMTGERVPVAPPEPDTVDALAGLASLDPARRQAQAVVGGADGAFDVVFAGVPGEVLGRTVTVTVAEARWSGYEGAHPAPRVLARTTAEVADDGTVTVAVRGAHRKSAYRVVLTPAPEGQAPPAPSVPWRDVLAADSAAVTAGTLVPEGSLTNHQGYAAWGAARVEGLNGPDSAVEFAVSVPEDATYAVSFGYGNGSGSPARQRLSVDGRPVGSVEFPATLNAGHTGLRTVPLPLTAGPHALTLAWERGEIALDRVELAPHTEPLTRYEATLADVAGDPAYRYPTPGEAGTLVLGEEDSVTFDVFAPRDGYHTVTSRGADRELTVTLHGATVPLAPGRPARLLLAAGNNRITARGPGAVAALEVAGHGETEGLAAHEAAAARLAGGARLEACEHATGGSCLAPFQGPGASATWTVRASRAGRHLLVVRYAHDDRADNGHAYNADVISRTALLRVGEGPAQRMTFRNSLSWDNFWTLALPVDLAAGEHPLTLTGPEGPTPRVDRVLLGPVVG